MSLLYKWALLEEKQRKERSEQRSIVWETAVQVMVEEDNREKRIDEKLRRLAVWAKSLPKPSAKQKDISLLDVMFS